MAYNSTFPAVVNDNLCNWIADNVAAGAGVPMPLPNDEQRDPTLNVEGGFWRIAYPGHRAIAGAELGNAGAAGRRGPAGLVQSRAGRARTRRRCWAIEFRTAKIEVYDNIDMVGGVHTIGIHDASYWTGTDPASITIYRLDPNQQYLINGTSLGEVIQGSVYNNLIRPGGGADTITGGLGDNEIEGATEKLNGITVTDFNIGDAFDFTNLSDPTQVSADFDGTWLNISSHHVDLASIALPSLPSTATFTTLSDGHGGTLVELVPCYCRGTLIRTARGDSPVEALAIGDKVITAAGAARPIKWIGRRSYDGRFARGRHLLPVCIEAGALDDNVPARDLWISPHHAMFLEGVLIEARDLLNGVTITQAESVRGLEYFHVELEFARRPDRRRRALRKLHR